MAKSMFDPDLLRARFHSLKDEIAAIEAETAPHRARYAEKSAIADKALAEARAIGDQFNGIEKARDLYGKKNEMAAVARALGGRTGAAPEPEAGAVEPAASKKKR